jgi:hypothetical protein
VGNCRTTDDGPIEIRIKEIERHLPPIAPLRRSSLLFPAVVRRFGIFSFLSPSRTYGLRWSREHGAWSVERTTAPTLSYPILSYRIPSSIIMERNGGEKRTCAEPVTARNVVSAFG